MICFQGPVMIGFKEVGKMRTGALWIFTRQEEGPVW
jgi:hypothetical protein